MLELDFISAHMVNVFLTVDTEVWPRSPNWRETALGEDIKRDIYGACREGEFGLPYQMDVLNAHGLKAVFFLEALFACAVGLDPLRQIVSLIQDNGHEVQLHIHTEWLAWMHESPLPGRRGHFLKGFSDSEQALLIATGLQNLRNSGACKVCAFRAGNYGANFDTLRALARNGMTYDTSYNAAYLGSYCGIHTADFLLQPMRLEGVYEFPITFFKEPWGRNRHTQIAACSGQELEQALLNAWKQNWYSFVIVSHGFELIKNRKQFRKPASADCIVINRFERLCRFLANNRDKFRTATFSEIDDEAIPPTVHGSKPLRSAMHHTAWRLAEQILRRVL